MSEKILKVLQEKLVKEMGNPYFCVQSHNIQILNSPVEFYLAICKGIRISHKRLVLTSLYMGDGPLEVYLFQQLQDKLLINQTVRIDLLFDNSRGRRGDKASTERLLSDLKANFMPNHNLRIGFLKNFKSFDSMVNPLQEARGVQHMKMAVFDDNVLLTGANLSDSYFTDREDRWIVFKECKELADYCDDLANSMIDIAGQMDDEGLIFVSFTQNPRIIPSNERKRLKMAKDRVKFFKFMQEDMPEIPFVAQPQSSKPDSQETQLALYEKIEDLGKGLKKVTDSSSVFNALKDMPEEFNIITGTGGWKSEVIKTGGPVYLFPALQMHTLDCNDDLELLKALIPEFKSLYVSSAYMSFPSQLLEGLKKVEELHLMSASPYANGFLGDGVKDWIPYFYRFLRDKTMKTLPHAKVYEYFREGWTFHSKGLWADGPGGVFFSSIGGSNLSNRSFLRDAEFQVYMWTECPELKRQLMEEKNRIWRYGYNDKDLFPLKYGIPTQILTRLFKSFL